MSLESDALEYGITQFDFDLVADRLDGTSGPPGPDDSDFYQALNRIFRWIVDIDPRWIPPERRALLAGRRAYVLAWAIMPGAVNNMTLRDLAKHLATQPQRLCDISVRLPDELSIRNARQRKNKSRRRALSATAA